MKERERERIMYAEERKEKLLTIDSKSHLVSFNQFIVPPVKTQPIPSNRYTMSSPLMIILIGVYVISQKTKKPKIGWAPFLMYA